MSEIPTVNQQTIEWGFHQQPRIHIGMQTVYSCFHISQDNYIAITNKSVVLFQPGRIRETLNLSLSSAVYIPDQEIIIGMSAGRSQFYVLHPNELQSILAESIATGQIGVFKMYYAQKSHVLISIGEDIRFWNFSVEVSTNKLVSATAKCEFTLRAKLNYNFKGNFLSAPTFSPEEELLALQKESGFVGYNVDGEQVRFFAKTISPARICTDYFPEQGHFMTADCINGLCLWNRFSAPIGKVLIGDSSVCYCSFLDDEYVLLITERLDVYIVDIIINTVYFCMNIEEKPSSILLHKNTLFFDIFCSMHNGIDHYIIDLPFRSWLKGVVDCTAMRLVPKIGKAPRLIVETKNAYITFITPKGPYKLTTSSSPEALSINQCYYDRGILGDPTDDTDNMLVAEGTGVLDNFETNSIPCKGIASLKGQYIAIWFFNASEGPTYVAASRFGDIMYIDRKNFKITKRVLINADRVEYAIGENVYNTFIIFSKTQIFRFDVDTATVIDTIDMKMPSKVEINGDIMCMGYPDGFLTVFQIFQSGLKKKSRDDAQHHKDQITGISIRDNIIASVSDDCHLMIWNYRLDMLCSILLPVPLAGVVIVNGYRDVIVGTGTNLMIIHGNYLFDGPPVPEDTVFDSYCRLDDALYEKYIKKNIEIEEIPVVMQETRSPRRVRKLKINTLSSMHSEPEETAKEVKKSDQKEDVEMTDEEKAMMLAEMSNLTENLDNPQQKPPINNQISNNQTVTHQPTEEEDKNEEDQTDDAQNNAQTPQKVHKKKKIIKKKRHRQSSEMETAEETPEVHVLGQRKSTRRQISKTASGTEINIDGLSSRPEIKRKTQKVTQRIRHPSSVSEDTLSETMSETEDSVASNSILGTIEEEKENYFWKEGEVKNNSNTKSDKNEVNSESEISQNNDSNTTQTKSRRKSKKSPTKSSKSSKSKKNQKIKKEKKKKVTKKVKKINKDGVEVEEEEEVSEYIYYSDEESENNKIDRNSVADDEETNSNTSESVRIEGNELQNPNSSNNSENNSNNLAKSSSKHLNNHKLVLNQKGELGFYDENGKFLKILQEYKAFKNEKGEYGFYDASGHFIKCPDGKLVQNEKGEIGFFDENGKFVIYNMKNGLMYGPKGKLGILDANGNFVESKDSKIVLNEKGEKGIYDQNGNFVLLNGPKHKPGDIGFYDVKGNFTKMPEGKLVAGNDGEMGFLDDQGNFVKIPQGGLQVGKNGEMGYFDDTGKFVKLRTNSQRKGIVDKDGNFVPFLAISDNQNNNSEKTQVPMPRVKSEGGIRNKYEKDTVKDGLVKGPNGDYGIIDENGNFIASSEGKIVLNDSGERGIIDSNGVFHKLPQGKGPFVNEKGEVGFYDKNGYFVTLDHGKLSIGPNGVLGTYDENGIFIECPDVKLIVLDNGAKGYYDSKGNFIILVHATNKIPCEGYSSQHRSQSTTTYHRKSYRFSSTSRSKSPQRIYWTPDVIPPNIVLDRNVAIQRFLDGDLRFLQCIKNFQVMDGRLNLNIFEYIETQRLKTVPQSGFFNFENSVPQRKISPKIPYSADSFSTPRSENYKRIMTANYRYNNTEEVDGFYSPREPYYDRISSVPCSPRARESPVSTPKTPGVFTPRARRNSGRIVIPFNGTTPVSQLFPSSSYSPLIVKRFVRIPKL
ncbi:hypothetical protein TVAG_139490 [Trichomonas vaginalis G3]|uniref:Uncharacterized protein n=1 Tax=Trichomonas vaginalis (strain ATCC PRA-98 / G3) TaxID=412133 RepID=A2EJ16_TRIV3|nr:WD40 repeat-like family [Trichomonas vaginalis G3]EAY07319.1 hypothetical protein TVAG_139490 [Trichomonas vaginalis G3]KAI5524490.1 WD40 repeat-like family [Trichomonas vaginalis G3]|eukprot:XP_001319542.1 hypothetical protein [Trichomonas vaginalis G3]